MKTANEWIIVLDGYPALGIVDEVSEDQIEAIQKDAMKQAFLKAAELIRPTNDNLKLWPDSTLLIEHSKSL